MTQSFSNDWEFYRIQAVLDEEKSKENGLPPWPKMSAEEIQHYNDRVLENVEAQLYLLPLPITTHNITDIVTVHINGHTIRLYPPFPVNEKAEASASFSDINIPTGHRSIEHAAPLPQSTVKGLTIERTAENVKWCRGFRMDVEADEPCLKFLDILIEQIAQYTQQWWLRAIHNPFRGPLRFMGQIDRDFNFLEAPRYEGAGEVQLSWYGACQSQQVLTIGRPLTNDIWIQCCNLAAVQQRAETGIMAYLDGVAAFMANRINQSILHLCIAVEILTNKHRQIIEGKADTKLDKLVRETPLLNSQSRETIKCLMIDRNHVAHGREPHCLGKKPEATMQNYIEKTNRIVNAYLDALRTSGKWSEAMNFDLNKKCA